MLTVTLEKPGRFVVGDAADPTPGPGEALVRVERIGVCGTDIHAFHGRHPFIQYPIILGHELSGTVVTAPANDRGVAPGVRVSIEPFRSCGDCVACRKGKANCCENMYLIGVHVDGGMQPFLCVEPKYLHPSATLSHDQLATIEPLSIGAHAVERGDPQAGERVLIVGAGPIGVAALQFALLAGAQVTMLEINDARRQWVADTFAINTLAARDDSRYALVIDASGNPKAMSESFHSVEHGGRLVFVGVIKAKVEFDDALLHSREITLLASRNSHDAFPGIIRLIEQGRFDPTGWITHRMQLSQVPEQFADVVSQPGVIKPMIEVPQE